MDYWYLTCSFSWIVVAFAFYQINKLWYKEVTENNKLYKFQIKFGNIKAWAGIIMCVVAAIIYFFKAIG